MEQAGRLAENWEGKRGLKEGGQNCQLPGKQGYEEMIGDGDVELKQEVELRA